MFAPQSRGFLAGWTLVSVVFLLSGCGGGSSSGDAAAATAAGTPTASVTNSAPTISGSPPTSTVVGSNYSFKPTVRDPNGDKVTFSISGKPSWATFNTLTGALTGVASNISTYSNIVITANDSNGASASLPAFSIAVTAKAAATGTATLGWVAPIHNTDGSPLTDLDGYVVYWGTNASQLTDMIQIDSASTLAYTVAGLAVGNTYYFAIASVNSLGVQSALSAVGSKTIT